MWTICLIVPIIFSAKGGRIGEMKIWTLVAVLAAALAFSTASVAADPLLGNWALSMSNAQLGGGAFNDYTPGVYGKSGVGLNNIGLLVRTWGKVKYVDETNQCFWIDDKSGLREKTEEEEPTWPVGLRVSYKDLAPGNSFIHPAVDHYVIVIGICSTTAVTVGAETRYVPTLRPRNYDDKVLDIAL